MFKFEIIVPLKVRHVLYCYRCELSQRLLPTFEKLADSFNDGDNLKLAKVNCDDDEEFCNEKEAKGKNEPKKK